MSRPNSWLCSICTQVIQTSSGRIGRDATCTPPGQSLERFQQAAADDCFICAKVWNLTEQHREAWGCLPPESWSPFCYIIDMEEYPKDTLHQIRVRIVYNDPTEERIKQPADVRFRLIPSIGSGYENLFVFPEIEDNTGSSKTLDLAYSWFRECESHHEGKCKAPPGQTEGWLPSRLIDIGQHGDTHWKLLITRTDMVTSSSVPLPYLTLSYRWGDNVQYDLLTSSTMNQFRQGVEISNLARTFQDTVLVARRLNIRYIWIDCLCIIQDSRDDWEAEAPEMRHIYANAACNIAASASDNAYGGLFRSRNVRDIHPG